jgi:hypothetical protein
MERRIRASLGAAALLAAISTTALAGGPPGVAFYVDGELYRTVGTPTDFAETGAPASSFDTVYEFFGTITNVASSAPGDRDFNGGRWMVIGATWNVTPYPLHSEEDVLAAEAAGDITLTDDPIKWFECPVIPLQGNA